MTLPRSRNLFQDYIKLAAACAVVILHVRLPSRLGIALSCLARIAVPFFFAIAGYHSFQISSEHIRRRVLHSLKILIGAYAVNILFGLIYSQQLYELSGWEFIKSLFDLKRILLFFLTGYNRYFEPLWFLSAHVFCYLVLLVYVRFCGNNYHPLYIAGCVLIVLYWAFSVGLRSSAVNIDYVFYMNGLFFGLPLFMMGMFIREHQQFFTEQLHWTALTEVLLILLGIVLSLLQVFLLHSCALPFGTVLELLALILLVTTHPLHPPANSSGDILGEVLSSTSLLIYILHPIILTLFEIYLEQSTLLSAFHRNKYIYLVAILLPSVLVSASISILITLLKRERVSLPGMHLSN